jgi:methionyl aminopeptidase
MIYYKTHEEIELIRESSLLVSKTLAEVAKIIRPGITTEALDKRAEEFIRDHGALPAFKGYKGFRHTLCISTDHQVVHGIPSDRVIRDGEVVSVDCGVKMNGFFGDSAFTFPVGNVSADKLNLLKVTRESLERGVAKAVAGMRMGDISAAVQEHAEQHGYSCVRELVGHGIGRDLHEKPEVPNYGKRGSGMKLQEGLVIAIEPMINMGKSAVVQEDDGWTVSTRDGKASAHFEHTVAVQKGKVDILTTFRFIEEVVSVTR